MFEVGDLIIRTERARISPIRAKYIKRIVEIHQKGMTFVYIGGLSDDKYYSYEFDEPRYRKLTLMEKILYV